jgi:hypothetical protein
MTITKKYRLSEEIERGTKYLGAGLLIVISITAFLYFANIGISSQMGYSFKVKEIENNKLKNQNENLQLKVLKASSFSQISTRKQIIQNMQPAAPEYFETRLDRLSKN